MKPLTSGEVKHTVHLIGGIEMYQFVPATLQKEASRDTLFFYHGGGFTSNDVPKYMPLQYVKSASFSKILICAHELTLEPPCTQATCENTERTSIQYGVSIGTRTSTPGRHRGWSSYDQA